MTEQGNVWSFKGIDNPDLWLSDTKGVVTFENVDAYTYRLMCAAPEMAELLERFAASLESAGTESDFDDVAYTYAQEARTLLSRIRGET